MKLKKSIKSILWAFILFAFISFWGNGLTLHGQDAEETAPPYGRLQYEVSVDAQLIPFYVLDANDNPVYDLKKEDIQLFINKSPREIIFFTGYQFKVSEEVTVKRKEPAAVTPARYVFIILDAVFNSVSGLSRSAEISEDIISNSSPGDVFVFLENNRYKGLEYVIGPTKNREMLLKTLAKRAKAKSDELAGLKRLRVSSFGAGVTRGRAFNIKGYATAENKDYEEKRQLMMSEWSAERIRRRMKRAQLARFSNALLQLEYAFKTITRPKVVYLISEGAPQDIYESGPDKIFYYKYLENAAKGINKGGSLLYVINPRKWQMMDYYNNSGKEALKLLADKGNGRYFDGPSIQLISKKLRKSTAAYYELAFSLKDIGRKRKKIKVKIRSKRKDIKIYSIKQTERSKPYRAMPDIQKKLFALNVVTRGSWSRMVGQVHKVNYKKIDERKKSKKTVLTVEVPLPAEMQNRPLDIFTLNLDPKTLKADFDVKQQSVKQNVRVDAFCKKDKDRYFVIIEPETSFCVYNQII